jgi:hypothetical protein
MALWTLVFMVDLKMDVCKSKISLQNGLETHEPNVPSFLGG